MTGEHETMGRDLGTAMVNSIPPIAGTVYTLNGVVAALTVVFIILQIAYLSWKWRRDIVRRAEDKAAMDALMKRPVARVGDKAPP